MIVTNLSQFYSSPVCKAPLGSSDHSIVFWQPNRVRVSKATRSNANKFPLPRMPESALCAFGRWVSTQDWADVFSHTSISDCVLAFTAKVNSTVDLFFPLKMVRSHPNDKPWMTPHIKDLIL